MKAGYSETDITPPVGSAMAAFPSGPKRIPRRSAGVHDRLMAKALAIKNGRTTVCICACDVLLWQAEDITRIRDAITNECESLSAENIIIAATHTHSSGENTYLFGGKPEDAWVVELRQQVVATVLAALNDLEEASISFAQIEAPYNHNRRAVHEGQLVRGGLALEYVKGLTEGPVDPTLSVIRFDRGNGTGIIWANWTGHGVTVGPTNNLYSADYPGALSLFVNSRIPDYKIIFTNGAAGNVHPKWCIRDNFEAAEKVGGLLGEKVVEAFGIAKPITVDSLRSCTKKLELPNRADASLTVTCEITCFHLDDIILGFLPGEQFVEVQLQLRQHLEPTPVVLTGYANGWVGYVPMASDYAIEGYGVKFCQSDPARYSRTQLNEGSAEKILEALLTIARH